MSFKLLYLYPVDHWKKIIKKQMPTHQLFGMFDLIDNFKQDRKKTIGYLKDDLPGEVHFLQLNEKRSRYIPKIIYYSLVRIKHGLRVLFSAKKYDLIFDVQYQIHPFIGVAKRCGFLRNTEIMVYLHNPRTFKLAFMVGRCKAYLFYCEEHYNYAIKLRPDLKHLFYLNKWFPDINYYINISAKPKNEYSKPYFIDNGRTERDHNILIKASEYSSIPIIIPKASALLLGSIPELVNYYEPNFENDILINTLIYNSRGIVIPLKKRKNKKTLLTPYGITSFLDAIALGVPVICSDNACFVDTINKHKLGLVFDSSSALDLSHKLEELYYDNTLFQQLSNNIKEYSKTHTIHKTSYLLKKIILAIKNSDN